MFKETLREKISHKQEGWANGHDSYMVINISIDKFLEFLDKIGVINDYSDAEFGDNSIKFEGNGDRFLKPKSYEGKEPFDFLEIISTKFPDALCFWADDWDYPAAFECIKNGLPSNQYTSEITISDDDEDTYMVDLYIKAVEDDELTFALGGGMIEEDAAKELIRIATNGICCKIDSDSSLITASC